MTHRELGINPDEGFLVAGQTAGAHIALTVAHLYRGSFMRTTMKGIGRSIGRIVPQGWKCVAVQSSRGIVVFG
jgi:hypothetical protein